MRSTTGVVFLLSFGKTPQSKMMSRSSSIVGTTTQTHQNNPDENNEF
jgi:hypothetical protein